MDLSALIFVVLALAWGVYLIPKALKHHDDVASERLEESHSDRARVLSRRRTTLADGTVEEAEECVEVTSVDETRPARRLPSLGALVARRASRPARPELSTAGRAARNRRRVLAALCTVLAVTWALTWFAYLPAITPLWPSLAVVAWLVVARLSVVRMQRTRRSRPAPSVAASPVEHVETTSTSPVEQVGSPVEPVEAMRTSPVELVETTLPAASHDSFDSRPEVVAEREALADDGSLWDPLPLTLPTYVGKATARRTVRTIELTGMTSSGHDAADSALAREAEVEAAAEEAERLEQERQRRVAGA
ncbi:divisome protein SepX/GlpR [Nocardioides marmoraquaticus]